MILVGLEHSRLDLFCQGHHNSIRKAVASDDRSWETSHVLHGALA